MLWWMPFSARSPTAISARTFRRAIRNGRARRPTAFWPLPATACAPAKASSPISTRPWCAKPRACRRIATPCGHALLRSPASPPIVSPSKRRPARRWGLPVAAKALSPWRPRPFACRGRPRMKRGMTSAELRRMARRVLDLCRTRGLRIATAESCTGGLVAGALTDIAGSSDVVDRGFVTYSNAAKEVMLGVPEATLKRHGAVSGETAAAMVKGALKNSLADIAVSITGIAGPGGGTKEKPVGLVYFAAARRGGKRLAQRRLYGNIGRSRVRAISVSQALAMLETLAKDARRSSRPGKPVA